MKEFVVCNYLTYFESLIYYRTELLTSVKFGRYVWTGFCGPTGDGKWSHHKISSIYHQKFWNCTSVWGFADIANVVQWLRGRFLTAQFCASIPVSIILLRSPLHHLDFMKKFGKSEKKCKIWILWFSEFRKIRIDNFINSNYLNYLQKFANSNNSNFWPTDE